MKIVCPARIDRGRNDAFLADAERIAARVQLDTGGVDRRERRHLAGERDIGAGRAVRPHKAGEYDMPHLILLVAVFQRGIFGQIGAEYAGGAVAEAAERQREIRAICVRGIAALHFPARAADFLGERDARL